MKQTYIFIFVFLVLCSFASAPPPSRTVEVGSYGLQISYPQLEYIINDTSTNYEYIRWWVYNVSNGVVMTNGSGFTGVNCTYNLMDNNGRNILRATNTDGTINFGNLGANACVNCFNYNISKLNFTYYGGYYYQIRCQRTNEFGGFFSAYFKYVNESYYDALFAEPITEETFKDSSSSISVVLFLLSINMLLFYFGFRNSFKNFKYLNFIIKRSCLVIAFWFLSFNTAIIATITNNSGLGINKELYIYMNLFGWGGVVAMMILVIGTIFELIRMWYDDKKQKRYGIE